MKARRSSVLTEDQQDFLERRLQNRPRRDSTTLKAASGNTNNAEKLAPSLAASAKKLERQMISDSLNSQLYARADVETLHQANIAKSGVAPRLQNAKASLERALTKDQVGHQLADRPDVNELFKSGIHKGTSMAPMIQGVARKLEHNINTDKVGHLLERRSQIEDLQAQGILSNVRVSSAIQKQQKDLQKSLAKSNLYHALKHRPSLDELQDAGYLPEEYDPFPFDDEQDYRSSEFLPGDYEDDDDEYYYEDEYGNQYTKEDYIAQQRKYANMAAEQAAQYDQAEQDYYDAQAAHAQYEADQERYRQEAEDFEWDDVPDSEVQPPATSYQRRSKNFHLTRILLKFVASMAEAGEIDIEEKGFLKDLVVDQDQTILAVAETFDAENDLADFKDSLVRLASRAR
eukprot:CAMPEP_0175144196 /NCGR_PEP_ID=MMETSP0087-20121206/13972_1 /TAXON_ID=136419 /ORGANISM="Unknown Unknown, Strain D1" /LENGTH=401 /DNA_ID=CAMNT_0016428587 /DNA_START=23 /DNA_END=1228 /DNA_ORIENTATION=-